MPVEVFPEDLIASTYTRIRDAGAIKVDIDLLAHTWAAIDKATPYSVEQFAFTHTEIDKIIPTNVDIFAETWTQIDDAVWSECLDRFFYVSIDHVELYDWELHDDIPYIDNEFILYIPEFKDFVFRIESVDPWYDVEFEFSVYDFEDYEFKLYWDVPYLDVDFSVCIGGALEVEFLFHVPSMEEYEFVAKLSDYLDINIHIPMQWYYIDNSFRMKHIPTFLGYCENQFTLKIVRFIDFSLTFTTLERQLPAAVIIRSIIR